MTTTLATLRTYLTLGDFESARRTWLTHLIARYDADPTSAALRAVVSFTALSSAEVRVALVDVVAALGDAA